MSVLITAARTNYFRVKNPEDFEARMSELGMEVLSKSVTNKAGEVHVEHALIADEAGWYLFDGETEEEIDPGDLLRQHLEHGSVALMYEVGYDSRMRSVYGYVRAVTPGKLDLTIDLQDITSHVLNTWGITVPPWP